MPVESLPSFLFFLLNKILNSNFLSKKYSKFKYFYPWMSWLGSNLDHIWDLRNLGMPAPHVPKETDTVRFPLEDKRGYIYTFLVNLCLRHLIELNGRRFCSRLWSSQLRAPRIIKLINYFLQFKVHDGSI